MIDKANVIYDRWSAGYELPSVVLGPSTSDDGGTDPGGSLQHNTMDHHYGISSVNQYGVEQPQPSDSDPFARFHPRLVQCVVEVRERAKSLFLSRNASLPPTWGPTPVIHSPCSPVLPPEVPEFTRLSYSQNGLGNGYNGMSSSSFYSNTAYPEWAPSTSMALSPTSKMAIVDTINFELGALNDQSWMAFF